jgi:hypothetical protein
MISANQLYKQSKTNLTFKEWLKQNQREGILENHEQMYNLIDDAENSEMQNTTLTKQEGTKKLGTINLIGIVGIVILIYGLSRVTTAE